jgi:G3E family GTPase
MRLYLFSGFLGSGKTTLVTTIAKHLIVNEKKKIMLIVNDIGDIGIDGSLMRKLDTDVYELFGTCICTQIGNVINMLKGVGTKYIVDDILLEASGIAQPKNFLDTIKNFGPEDMSIEVIALADATRWLDLRQVVDDLLVSQINSGDYILINKIDAVSPEILEEVILDIKNINPNKKIITMSTNNSNDAMKVFEVMRNGECN